MNLATATPANPAKVAQDITLCYYANPSADVQVLRIKESQNFYFEKVIFPQERLFFSAPRSSTLQVFNQINGALSFNAIPCAQIQVTERAAKR